MPLPHERLSDKQQTPLVCVQHAVSKEHAQLIEKGKQVYAKALVGESVFDKTYSWIDGVEMRPNVSYILASQSQLAFGSQSEIYTIQFEEPSGANPLLEMMMQGFASGANADVKDALKKAS
eukprot:jgi/Chrzof1/13422/Cz07g32130.t1